MVSTHSLVCRDCSAFRCCRVRPGHALPTLQRSRPCRHARRHRHRPMSSAGTGSEGVIGCIASCSCGPLVKGVEQACASSGTVIMCAPLDLACTRFSISRKHEVWRKTACMQRAVDACLSVVSQHARGKGQQRPRAAGCGARYRQSHLPTSHRPLVGLAPARICRLPCQRCKRWQAGRA